jgi:hypothetical protein
MIKPISLGSEGWLKLTEMINHFLPDMAIQRNVNYPNSLDVYDKDGSRYIFHWFEFCFTVLSDKVAIEYAKAHISTTYEFAKYAVLQKIAHETHKTSAVETLYDIWKRPKDYRVD